MSTGPPLARTSLGKREVDRGEDGAFISKPELISILLPHPLPHFPLLLSVPFRQMLLKAPASRFVDPERGQPSCSSSCSLGTSLLLSQKGTFPTEDTHDAEGPNGTSVWAGLRTAAEAPGKPRAHHFHGRENACVWLMVVCGGGG